MAKSIDDALREARSIINDEDEPFRYSNASLLRILNTALREVYSLRPDAFVGNFHSGVLSANDAVDYTEDDLEVAPTETAFPIDDRIFYSPVVLYVAGKAELSDDEFANDGRAMTILQAFRNNLTSK